jgi:hypothetical protein
MTKTTGERAKQEADAFKARAWFRDLANSMFGAGEYKDTAGKPLKMRHELRDQRVQVQEKKHQSERVRKCGTVWADVHSMEWVHVCDRDAKGRDVVSDMMEMLMRQTPDIFNRYDEPEKAQRFAHSDVSAASLGAFKIGKNADEWGEYVLSSEIGKTSPDI